MGRTAFIFPGQGSQYVGMGRALWEGDADVRGLYSEAKEEAGLDIAGVSFEGPGDELDEDVTAQVAVYVCNEAHRIAAMKAGLLPDALTGYSMGFYSALTAAGCVSFAAGLAAVRRAGELALEDSAARGTMGAVIGLSVDEVRRLCDEASGAGGVWVSNINAARQILVSGTRAGVGRVVELAPGAGALSAYTLVMGAAYHSPMMSGAAELFAQHVSKMDVRSPKTPLLSYTGADYLDDAQSVRAMVAGQIASVVRWKDSVQRLLEDGVDRFVEVGPGEALTRMVRWVDRDARAVSMQSLLDAGIRPQG